MALAVIGDTTACPLQKYMAAFRNQNIFYSIKKGGKLLQFLNTVNQIPLIASGIVTKVGFADIASFSKTVKLSARPLVAEKNQEFLNNFERTFVH